MDNKKSIKKSSNASKQSKKGKKFKIITKKQEKRLENVEVKRNYERAVLSKIAEYREDFKNSNDGIIQKSTEIFKKIFDETYDDNDKINYEALVTIIDEKNFESSSSSMTDYYPDYSDKDFNKKIYQKLEFYLNRNVKPKDLTPSKREELSQQLCNPLYGDREKEDIVFNLTKNQKFLKAFLSPQTQYNSLLLYHGTGVGKTCSSISIAEQYSDELERLNKKIVILLNPSIEANFLKNIFNINKLKEGMTYYQCTGEKYLREIPDFDTYAPEVLERKIKKIIKKRYVFYGYQTFANIIEKMEEIEKESPKIFRKKIKEAFSDCVFIIDEVHNIKEGDDLKVLPPKLEKVFKETENTKLLLLSATPMYDTSNEIIFLMNLMLNNDGKPTMKEDDYFDRKGYFKGDIKKEDDKITKKFLEKTRGYISFVRGKNPLTFPEAIYPEDKVIKKNDFPTTDKDGVEIDESERIKELKIISCPMHSDGLQKRVYENSETDKTFGAFNQPALMCSNIVFPKLDEEDEMENFNLDKFVGDIGLKSIVSKSRENKNIKYKFKNDVFENAFKLEQLKKYSSKIYSIIKNINESKGIVFIYSQFIGSGIIPLALALEKEGYKKMGSSLLSRKYESPNTKGNYIIISGNNDLSKNAYRDYIKFESENKDGKKVKIIIGSRTAAEGLDFKYIREIHILDPWFHYNRIEQIIGRGIRNCSHIDLPPKERNVKIFLYASTKSKIPKNDNETIDLKMYRIAEVKTKQMARIEYLLKKNAVDCNLNREYNIFDNDKENSRECNYNECNYKCLPENLSELTGNKNKSNPNGIDYSTTTIRILDDQINDVINLIKFGNYKMKPLFKVNNHYSFESIKSILEKNTSLKGHESKVIFLALHKLLINGIKLEDKNKNIGTIVFRNKMYIFIPDRLRNKFFTYNNLSNSRNNKYNKIAFNNINFAKSKKNNTTNNTIFSWAPIQSERSKTEIDADIESSRQKLDLTFKHQINLDDRLTTQEFLERKIKEFFEKNKNKYNSINVRQLEEINKYIYGNIGYNIDYMPSEQKEDIIKCLIKLKVKGEKMDDKNAEKMMKSCKNIIKYGDVYHNVPNPTDKKNEEIFGYKIAKNGKLEYYKFNYKTYLFHPVLQDEKKLIEKSRNKIINEYNKGIAKVSGYLWEKLGQRKIEFKIRDKATETKSKKKTSKLGNKSNHKLTEVKTGKICNNDGMKKPNVIKFIQGANVLYQEINNINIFQSSEKEFKKTAFGISDITSIINVESDLDKIKKGYEIKIKIRKKDSNSDSNSDEIRYFKENKKKLEEVELTEEQVKKVKLIQPDINYKNTNKNDTPGKVFLCLETETYFRFLDLIDTQNRHFYNVEEAIEYKLNEKK